MNIDIRVSISTYSKLGIKIVNVIGVSSNVLEQNFTVLLGVVVSKCPLLCILFIMETGALANLSSRIVTYFTYLSGVGCCSRGLYPTCDLGRLYTRLLVLFYRSKSF